MLILALLFARALGGLPKGPLIVGYATDRCLSQPHRIDSAVEHGVNVIIWSFAHLERRAADGRLSVRPTFDVAQVHVPWRGGGWTVPFDGRVTLPCFTVGASPSHRVGVPPLPRSPAAPPHMGSPSRRRLPCSRTCSPSPSRRMT